MKTAWVLGWAVPEPWFAPLVRRQFPADEHVFFAASAGALTRLAAAGPFDRIVGYSLGALLLLGAAEQVNAALVPDRAGESGRGQGPRLHPDASAAPQPDDGERPANAAAAPVADSGASVRVPPHGQATLGARQPSAAARSARGASSLRAPGASPAEPLAAETHEPPRSPRVILLAPIFAFSAEEQLGGRIARTQVRALARWLRRDPAAAVADFYERAGLDVPAALAPADAATLAWGLTRLETDRVSPPLPPGWTAWCGAADALLDAARLHALDSRIRMVPAATHHPAALLAAFAASLPARPQLPAASGQCHVIRDTGVAALPSDFAATAGRLVESTAPLPGDVAGQCHSFRDSRGRAECHVIRDSCPEPLPPVVASFDRAATRYLAHARVQREMAAWVAEWLPAGRTGRALELGAGPGVFTAHLLPWPGGLVPTDLSAAMVAAGRVAFPALAWQRMAAEEVTDGPWQWIFSSSMLQWSASPVNLLAGWRRRLGRGGRILAGLFVEDTLTELRSVIAADGPVPWRSVGEWRGALAAAGLRVCRDAVESRVFTYSSAAALWRSVHGVGAAPVRRATVGQVRRWLREYDARFAASSGGVRATWTFYRFEAEPARG